MKNYISNGYDVERIEKEYERYCSLFHSTVIAANNVACNNILKAILSISQSKYFRFKIKNSCRTLLTMINSYQVQLTDSCIHNSKGDRAQFMCDYLRENYDIVRKDIELFRLQIEMYLSKIHQEDAKLKASVFLAYVLTDYTSVLFKTFWQDAENNLKVHFNPGYDYANFENIRKELLKIVDVFDPNHEIDLDKDLNCKNAFRIIQIKMTGCDIINKSGTIALEFNEDIKKEVENKL